ncbi:MAG: hypothetical protein C0467_04020 [Planctomycetaceae bacterium]|nr:hypothetical protein [Planctomycetaceae bacterium]
MSDLATAVNAAFAYAHEPSDAIALLGPPSDAFRHPGPQGLLEFARAIETEEELNELVRRVVPTVGVPDGFKASVMALLCGTFVEWGADSTEFGNLLLARLPGFLAEAESVADYVETVPGEKLFAINPDGFRAWQALSLMMLATMAVVTRRMDFRQEARVNAELVMGLVALRERNKEVNFVAQTLGFTDGMELVVLHPGEGRGFHIELEAVNTNFHLFTLLQGELIGGGLLPGDPIESNVVGVARGEIPHESPVIDHARFHFYNWAGLLPDGSLAAADTETWIWGEAHAEEIPEFEGVRVVVLGPPVLGMREWDGNFFANIHDALRSATRVIGELTAEQVTAWIDHIRRAPR